MVGNQGGLFGLRSRQHFRGNADDIRFHRLHLIIHRRYLVFICKTRFQYLLGRIQLVHPPGENGGRIAVDHHSSRSFFFYIQPVFFSPRSFVPLGHEGVGLNTERRQRHRGLQFGVYGSTGYFRPYIPPFIVIAEIYAFITLQPDFVPDSPG